MRLNGGLGNLDTLLEARLRGDDTVKVPILEHRERLKGEVIQVAPAQVGLRPRRTGGRAYMGSPSPKDQNKRTWHQREDSRQEHLPV